MANVKKINGYDIKDATARNPTFSQASARANIASGEALGTLFGKIMKWYADLKTVAFSGSYNDLNNKPTIPTVNNGTLTIQRNGSTVATFTANQSGNTTANITDNNTTYAAGTGITISGSNNAIAVKYGTAAGTACQGNDSRLFDASAYSANGYTNNIINVNSSTLNLAKGTHFFNIQMKPLILNSYVAAGVGTKLFTINNVPNNLKYYTIPVAILTSNDVLKGFGVCLIWGGGEVFFYTYVNVDVGDKIVGGSTIWYV